MNKEMIELTLSTENERGLDFTKVCTDKTKVQNGEKGNTCNQCNYASSWAGNLRRHLITQSGEKTKNYTSSVAGNLRTHLKTHTEEKSNTCNQCDYISLYASALRTHLKHTQCGKNKEMQPAWLCIL